VPPLMVDKICVWVGGVYRKFGHQWSFNSTIAEWNRGSDQWIDGGAISNPPQKPPPPISEFEPAYGVGYSRRIFKAPNVFADDALTCGRNARFPFMLIGTKRGPIWTGPGWRDETAVDWNQIVEWRRHPPEATDSNRAP
jgi:hypothetical protein